MTDIQSTYYNESSLKTFLEDETYLKRTDILDLIQLYNNDSNYVDVNYLLTNQYLTETDADDRIQTASTNLTFVDSSELQSSISEFVTINDITTYRGARVPEHEPNRGQNNTHDERILARGRPVRAGYDRKRYQFQNIGRPDTVRHHERPGHSNKQLCNRHGNGQQDCNGDQRLGKCVNLDKLRDHKNEVNYLISNINYDQFATNPGLDNLRNELNSNYYDKGEIDILWAT